MTVAAVHESVCDPTETLAAPKGGNASAIRTCAENSLPRRDGAISERAAGKAKPR